MRSLLMLAGARPQFRLIASVVVPNQAGGILLVQEAKVAYRGQWNLPGGHIDHGEAPITAAIRELREETNITAEMCGLGAGSTRLTHPRDSFFKLPPTDPLPRPAMKSSPCNSLPQRMSNASPTTSSVRPAAIRRIIRSISETAPANLQLLHHIRSPRLLTPQRGDANLRPAVEFYPRLR